MAEVQSEVKLNGHHEESPSETIKTNGNGHAMPEIPKAKLAEIHVTDFMEKSLDKVASDEGFKNYAIKVVHGSAIGDGFIGLIFKVTINEENSDKSLNLILKTPPENEARRNQFGSMDLFRREIFMYNEVIPEFVRFQKERKIQASQGFYEFPKVYYAEYNDELDDAIIIMEDLKERGFELWDKFKPTPFENAKLIMQALGKFHAISFAMKVFKPEVFAKYKEMNDFFAEKFGDNQMAAMFKGQVDQALTTLDEGNVKQRNRVSYLGENFIEIMKTITYGKLDDNFAVVNHGDCWSNNFMYQYKGATPQKICLIDYQISRYASPALDLVYFLFTCTSGEMRAIHYDELLTIYHRSLKDLLDHMGGDTQSQFPFTAFLRQMKKYGKFGVIMAMFLISMLTTKNEDLPDMDYFAENQDEMMKDPEMMKQMMAEFMKGNKDYRNRMRPSLLDSMRYGYI